MRSKIITALVAGGLLVGAGFATSVIAAPGTASAQEDSTDTDQERKGPFHRGFEFLSGVLEDLVAVGCFQYAITLHLPSGRTPCTS